jgi:hypothetical protein
MILKCKNTKMRRIVVLGQKSPKRSISKYCLTDPIFWNFLLFKLIENDVNLKIQIFFYGLGTKNPQNEVFLSIELFENHNFFIF